MRIGSAWRLLVVGVGVFGRPAERRACGRCQDGTITETFMKQLLLAYALIAVPVAGFTIVELHVPATPAAAARPAGESLGDLSALEAIVTDTQTIAKSGDLAAAQTRITDFETQWDDAEADHASQGPGRLGQRRRRGRRRPLGAPQEEARSGGGDGDARRALLRPGQSLRGSR